jgi:hypothetical protein
LPKAKGHPMLGRNSRLLLSCLTIAIIAGGIWLVWPTPPKGEQGQPHPASSGKSAPRSTSQTTSRPKDSVPIATATESAPAPQRAAAPLIDSILKDQSLDNLGAARALAAVVQDSALSLDGRAEALAHLLNLSVGNESTLLLPLLKSPNLPDQLASTILSDALNSPLTWQADACLAVMARKTGKELHAQASEHLEFLTGEEHGDDVNAWTIAVRDTRAKWDAEGH